MADSEVDPLIGKVLSGRFEIVEPLGVGGMGRVYKALQPPLERVVALKVLNPATRHAATPASSARFFLEASVTAKLTHPNTITVHDYGRTDDGIFFIAMEYLEGRHARAGAAAGRPAAAGRGRSTSRSRSAALAARGAHAGRGAPRPQAGQRDAAHRRGPTATR